MQHLLGNMIGLTAGGAAVEAQLGELWFELHTGRIDAMKHVETRLEQDLLQQCRQSIERIRKDRILLVIAHRLSTVLHSDRIVVINDGRIEAVGRHEELLTASPTYKRMCDIQFADN